MLAVDIKKMKPEEVVEALALNTKLMDIDYESLEMSFANILASYFENENPLMEQRMLCHHILMGFYKIERNVVEAIADTMGLFRYILWCKQNLFMKEEVVLYLDLYEQFRIHKMSTSNTLNVILELLIQGLADSDPESITSLMEQLENQLNRLPDMVKEDIDLDGGFKALK